MNEKWFEKYYIVNGVVVGDKIKTKLFFSDELPELSFEAVIYYMYEGVYRSKLKLKIEIDDPNNIPEYLKELDKIFCKELYCEAGEIQEINGKYFLVYDGFDYYSDERGHFHLDAVCVYLEYQFDEFERLLKNAKNKYFNSNKLKQMKGLKNVRKLNFFYRWIFRRIFHPCSCKGKRRHI